MSQTIPPHFPTSLIRLTTKPTAQLSYTFIPATPAHTHTSLLTFLNGLGLPQASWIPVLLGLKNTLEFRPAMLTYDRYGQGLTTDRDPADHNSPDPTHAHDAMSAVLDLRQMIFQIAELKLGVSKSEVEEGKLGVVFVCNSIGCAIARLYAKEFPGAVKGMVFLDSIVANAEYVDMFPNPDAEGFDEGALPEGVSAQMVRDARHNVGMKFGSNVGSVEGLSRMNLASLLPYSDAPKLLGPDGKGPWITVVGHDFERFAEDSEGMGVPAILSRLYMNPKWNTYNEGLARITEVVRAKGPVQAPGAGHFIQRDNPEFVVEEVKELLRKIQV
jgi:pimeloyl-ACP methyl ester carboxylesterase